MTTIRNCKFAYRCDRKWEELDRHYKNNKNPLPDDVRYCGECEKAVYKITDDKELIKAIKLNRCVAIEITKEDLKEEMNKSWGVGSQEKFHTTMGLPMRPKSNQQNFDDFEDDITF